MHDNTLVAISLSISALGIVGLLFALIFLEPPLTTITDAGNAADGAAIKVQGTVVSSRALGDRAVITITAPADIDVITENATSSALAKGACVIIQGKKGSYNGAAQVTASKITLCK